MRVKIATEGRKSWIQTPSFHDPLPPANVMPPRGPASRGRYYRPPIGAAGLSQLISAKVRRSPTHIHLETVFWPMWGSTLQTCAIHVNTLAIPCRSHLDHELSC